MLAALLLVGVGMASCEKEERPDWDDDGRAGGVLDSDDHGITFPYKSVIVGNIPGDVRVALGECLTNIGSVVDDDTRLVVLSSFGDLDDATLERAYDNGATIAIVHPNQADLDRFFADHPDWEGHTEDSDLNGALLYSFDRDRCNFLIVGEHDDSLVLSCNHDEEEDLDEGDGNAPVEDSDFVQRVDFIDNHNPIYTYIGPWLEQLYADEQGRAISSRADEEKKAEGRANTPGTALYSKTFPYPVSEVVYTYNKNHKDEVKGSVAMTIQYEVAQLHLYEGEPGAGNYYLVKMYASLSSHDIYKGKWCNVFYGVYNRAVGYYAKSFSIVNYIWADSTGKPAPVRLYEQPTPSTTNGATEYTTSHTFSAELSFGVSANGGVEDGKTKAGAEGKAEAKFGWSNTKSETRSIRDVEIQEITSGNNPGWNIVFQNLPKYAASAKYGFEEGNALPFRSTQVLVGSWIWHEPTGTDNTEKKYYIVPDMTAVYEAQSFITTKADLKEHRFTLRPPRKLNAEKKETDEIDPAHATLFQLHEMSTQQAGSILLKNDFPDKYISHIEIYRLDSLLKNKTCFENKNSFAPGESIDLGYYFTKYHYRLRFKAKASGGNLQTYDYQLNNEIPLSHREVTTLHAANDFAPTDD